jgi:fucose permease
MPVAFRAADGSAPAMSAEPHLAPRLLTGLCYLAMMGLAIGLNLLPVFLTTLSVIYGGAGGLTQEQLGRLGAVMFGGLVVGIVVTGPLADRLGAKTFALLGNGLVGASLVAAAFAPGYATLGAALFFVGLGAGTLDMVLSPIVGALNPARRAAAMNWLHSFYCVGAVLTVLAGTLMLRAGFGWRAACLLLAPLPLAVLAGFAPLRFPALSAAGGRLRLRSLLRHVWFWGAMAAIMLGGATEAGLAQWLPAYAETALGFPAWVGGGALLLFSVAMAAGRMAVGAAGARLEPFRVMAWGCGLSAILFLAGSFLPVPPVALAACVAAGVTGSCLWPTMLAVTADRYPEGGASMYGALGAGGNVGGVVMPWIVGWVADWHDLHWGIAVSALAPAMMLPLVLALRARRES